MGLPTGRSTVQCLPSQRAVVAVYRHITHTGGGKGMARVERRADGTHQWLRRRAQQHALHQQGRLPVSRPCLQFPLVVACAAAACRATALLLLSPLLIPGRRVYVAWGGMGVG